MVFRCHFMNQKRIFYEANHSSDFGRAAQLLKDYKAAHSTALSGVTFMLENWTGEEVN